MLFEEPEENQNTNQEIPYNERVAYEFCVFFKEVYLQLPQLEQQLNIARKMEQQFRQLGMKVDLRKLMLENFLHTNIRIKIINMSLQGYTGIDIYQFNEYCVQNLFPELESLLSIQNLDSDGNKAINDSQGTIDLLRDDKKYLIWNQDNKHDFKFVNTNKYHQKLINENKQLSVSKDYYNSEFNIKE